MNLFTIGWLVIVGAGLILEGIALGNRREGDTLTEHVRWLTRESRIARVLLLLFLAWLFVHLLAPPGFV